MPQKQNNVSLKEIILRVKAGGPDRVLYSKNGEATSPKIAAKRYRITPDVVFIRNDGWTLGAPAYFEDVARTLWANDWIAWLRANDKHLTLSTGEQIGLEAILGQ